MAEAEDVLVDAARHATVYVHALWRRHRPKRPGPATVQLVDVAARIDLLVASIFAIRLRVRVAQPPAPTTLLAKTFSRGEGPRATTALAATDDSSIWLPEDSGVTDAVIGAEQLRLAALRQAMRASRGSAEVWSRLATPLLRDVYLLLEVQAADEALARELPGLVGPLTALRQTALHDRPDLRTFPRSRHALELFARTLLQRPFTDCIGATPAESSADASWLMAHRMAADFMRDAGAALSAQPLFKDVWTGELRAPEPPGNAASMHADSRTPDPAAPKPRSARLSRRPDVRANSEDEDDNRTGAWMIQASQPHEHAEDPFGMQRPTDRDEEGAADEYAESLADLQQARLVWTPGQAKEVFVGDDPPDAKARVSTPVAAAASGLAYPEWDYRIAAYRDPGASVHARPAPLGPQAWVDQTLAAHRSMLGALRRRFEMLRPQRTRLHRQLDGDAIDLESCVDAHADFRAGLPMSQSLYQSQRRSQRDTAILLLIDVSGSTDAWISAHRRVIDVEREALLLVCIALEGLGEPFAVQAFSGHGPHAVTVDEIKRFDEPYNDDVARRIAALEPDQYTRAGAAIRHASAALMQQTAAHRLLLLLSDGKPNDSDLYDGRYGIEDTHQAVKEAKLQGISPFCLTVDRSASGYLPAVFGARQYALLSRPELLPVVLLDWMKRLVRL